MPYSIVNSYPRSVEGGVTRPYALISCDISYVTKF